jgi:hypothetical protein
MTKTLLSGLLAAVLLSPLAPLSAQAQAPIRLQENAPERHVVVPGDTLWGIAAKFLKDPYRWPDVWEPNKDSIKNPNRIYPGNVIVLDRSGKTPRLRLATVKVEPRVRTETLSSEIPMIPPGVIEPFLAAPLVVEEGGLADAPKIVATQEGRVFLGAGDLAYARGTVPRNVQNWEVYRPGKAFIDPDTKETLGFEAVHVGSARTERLTDPVTLRVLTSKQEIGSGDRIIPTATPPLVNYSPRPPASDVRARVLSTYGGVNEAGGRQIIAISKGKRDGLELGHVLAVDSFGETVTDRSNILDRSTSRERVKLPDERNGLIFVFRVFEKVSYALVMSAERPIKSGDVARKP